MPEDDTLRDLVGRLGRADRDRRPAAGLLWRSAHAGASPRCGFPHARTEAGRHHRGATAEQRRIPALLSGGRLYRRDLADHAHAVSRRRGGDAARAQPRRGGNLPGAGQGRFSGRDHFVARKLPHLRHVIAVGQPPAGALAFASLRETPPDELLPRVAATDRFLLLYTSGTTAAPKGVPVDYRRFLINASRSAAELRIDPHVDPALRRTVHASLRAVLGQPRASRPAPRPRSCRPSRRPRSRPRSTNAVRPDCSSRRRTCRPASTKAC